MILKKELQKQVDHLNEQVARMDGHENWRREQSRRDNEKMTKLEEKIFELEQLIPEEEIKNIDDNSVYRVCDPKLKRYHQDRNMGVDVYFWNESEDKKTLLTRIPINVENYYDMSLEDKAKRLQPLIDSLGVAFEDYMDSHILVEASIGTICYSY